MLRFFFVWLDFSVKMRYNTICEFLQRPTRRVQMEKYSRGRRGAPAKGVGRVFPAREFKSLLLRQRKQHVPCGYAVFFLRSGGMQKSLQGATAETASLKECAPCRRTRADKCRRVSAVQHLSVTLALTPPKKIRIRPSDGTAREGDRAFQQ